MIDGNTQLVGLIGWPVGHSLSPAMHNAAFDAVKLNWRYVPLSVPPRQIEAAVFALAALGFRGANVTVPHKQAVISALDSVASNAGDLGAVNTLVLNRTEDQATTIRGYNTDSEGFLAALEHKGVAPGGLRNAVVIGAGGAARAIVHALLRSGNAKIAVLNRTFERAQALVLDLGLGVKEEPRLRALPLTLETLGESAEAADLLVNATTVGMWPHVEQSIWPFQLRIPAHLTVFDLVYNPLQTRFLEQTQRSGARAISGYEMLVQQGALAFEIWTEEPAPAEVMRNACKRALRKGAEAVRS